MFLKNIDDVSEEEFTSIVEPFDNDYDLFLKEFIIPEACAYYLAHGYYSNALWECEFERHVNSVLDTLNQSKEMFNEVKDNIIKILKIKYGLMITSENPLLFNSMYK